MTSCLAIMGHMAGVAIPGRSLISIYAMFMSVKFSVK